MGGLSISVFAVPAVIALSIKIMIVASWFNRNAHTGVSRPLIALIAALAALNLSEISFFWAKGQNLQEPPGGLMYFVIAVWMLSFLVHFCISEFSDRKMIYQAVYVYAVTLTIGISLGWVVDGYTPWRHAYTKIPGELYWTFEIFVLTSLMISIVVLTYNSFNKKILSRLRLKARWMLAGFSLSFLAIPFIIVVQHYSESPINSLITLPVTFTAMIIIFIYSHMTRNLISIPLPFSNDYKDQKRLQKLLKLVITTIERSNSNRVALAMLEQHGIILTRTVVSSGFSATIRTKELLHSRSCSDALETVVNKINEAENTSTVYIGFNLSSNQDYRLRR